jgi:hypothetical protein
LSKEGRGHSAPHTASSFARLNADFHSHLLQATSTSGLGSSASR